jgi:hypothetical protein
MKLKSFYTSKEKHQSEETAHRMGKKIFAGYSYAGNWYAEYIKNSKLGLVTHSSNPNYSTMP